MIMTYIVKITSFLCLIPWFVSICDASAQCEVSADGSSDPACSESASAIQCENEQWVSQNGTVPGYHVLCITRDATTNALTIEFFREAIATPQSSGQYISSASDMKSLRLELERILKIKNTDESRSQHQEELDKPNAWTIFSPKGTRIVDFDLCVGTLLVFEGGVWIYPAIHIGFARSVEITDEQGEHTTFTLTTLSVHPPVFQVFNFIRDADCDHIVAISEKHMKVSGVSHMHNTAGNADQWRTSTTHWLRTRDDITRRIEQHCSKLLRVPQKNQELIQVLRYEPTQQYDSHWDYFDPGMYRGTEMERKIRGGRNRMATLFWYMSDVMDGGWTYFPRSGLLPNPPSYKLKKVSDCEKGGLLVEPRKGAVILFYSVKPNGEVDPLSLHGACPVGEGNVKWGANIWYWTKDANIY